VRLPRVLLANGREQVPHLAAGEDDRQVGRAMDPGCPHRTQREAEDLTVQEQEGVERLVLGCGGDVALDGQVGEELLDLRRPGISRMAPGAIPLQEPDELLGPPDVRLLGVIREVADSDCLADLL
jgi:hypothetical protein